MKKFILILLMTFTLTSFFAINIFAINVDYTFNITDNKKWNLETGSIQNDLKFAVTSKMIIKDDRIITSSETYHHVVFWNSKNQFIGYKNSQYSILENDYYLGNIEYGSAGFDAPANAHFFSFMIYKSGNAINYTELNNQSLSDIFDLYNSSNLEDKDNNTLDGYSLDELYNTQLNNDKNLFDGFTDGYLNVANGTYTTTAYDATWSFTNGIYTLTTTNAFRGIRSNFISVLPNTSYTISMEKISGSGNTNPYISGGFVYYDINQNYLSYDNSNIFLPSGFSSTTRTTPANAYYIMFRLFNASATTSEFKNIQLEKGSTATPYEPYGNYLTRDYFKDYEQIANTNYTELDNGRLRYVVNQDTISSNSQPLYELNGLSLDDVFNTGNLFSSFNVTNVNASYSINNDILTMTDNTNSFQYLSIFNYDGSASINHLFYSTVEFATTDTNSNNRRLRLFDDTSLEYATTTFLKQDTNFEYFSVLGEKTQNDLDILVYNSIGSGLQNNDTSIRDVILLDLTELGIDNLTQAQLDAYFDIYAYFRDGGTDPQTFTYDSPIYYDITYRLDEQFNELDITAQEFIDNQDGYNRIINNEQANDFILYYAAQYAQDNNISLGLSIQQWEQYYLNYLTFDDANSPFIASLNYNSLNNIFLDGNLISNYDFSNGLAGWSNDGYGQISVIDETLKITYETNDIAALLSKSTSINFSINDKIYFNFDYKIPINNSFDRLTYTYYAPFSSNAYDGGTITYIDDNNWYNYSDIMIANQNTTSQRLWIRLFSNTTADVDVFIDNVRIISLNALGIDNLSQAQMDAYYDDYIDNQTLEQNLYLQALTPTSFDLIDPNYDYTAPPPDDFLDVDSDTFLDNLLTNIGFNNDLGKVTLSILILFLTTLTLIKFNLGTSVILGVDILVYVGLTFLGWLPAWINILIALIIMVLFYLRFKGGGSNNEESD